MNRNGQPTYLKNFLKIRGCKTYNSEFFSYFFTTINNLINSNMPDYLKIPFIDFLLFCKTIVFFKNDDDKLSIGTLSRVITSDDNFMPFDIQIRTLKGKVYNRTEGDYVLMYNTLPTDYLSMKIIEIAKVEKLITFLRNYYKMPVILTVDDSKAKSSIDDLIKKLFSDDEEDLVITIQRAVESGFKDSDLKSIDLKINYITDKLLDENEALKEDILETLGIYKNTSSNRERVNESELMIANSHTTVNKLGFENNLKKTIDKVNEKYETEYNINLNINKVFDIKNGSDNND